MSFTRETVEEHKKLSCHFLREHDYFQKGSKRSGRIIWSFNGTECGKILIETDMRSLHPTIRFTYMIRSSPQDPWVEMDYTTNLLGVPCNFGGTRWYFQCHLCMGRVAKLYDYRNYFCCRTCAGLSYNSCNENKRYRGGIWKFLTTMWGADDYYINNVKRRYYRGKPTRKYKRYLEMRGSVSDIKIEDLSL